MNNENLIPIKNREEAVKKGQAGGQKSGEVRRKKKTLREAMKILLSIKGVDDATGEEVDGYDKIAKSLYDKAIKGDIYAINSLRDLIGEQPSTKLNATMDTEITVEFNIPRPKGRKNESKD